MGISVTRPDGLLEPLNRAGSLSLLDRELERLRFKLQFEEGPIEVYYLYIKLMICCFAFYQVHLSRIKSSMSVLHIYQQQEL